jgi:hypothetical protein
VIAVACALLAVALGCAVVYRFGGLATLQPAWVAGMLVFGAGTAAGIGFTSCLFFLCRLAVPAVPRLSLFIEVVVLAWLGYEIVRNRVPPHEKDTSAGFPFTLLLLTALLVAAAIAGSAMTDAWEANPQGNWDAWSIWNLRARFLAAEGSLPQRAWSPALSWTHPEYPLLLSGFVARCWTYAGSTSEAAPIATAFLLFIALVAIVSGGFAAWRSNTLGLLLGLALLGTPTFLHEAISQYADIPLACYFAAATMFLLLDRPPLAGLFAGFAAWTKDEGALFLIVFLVAVAATRHSQLLRAATAAIPGAALMMIFKFALAPRAATFFGQGIVQRLTEPGKVGEILSAFVHEFGAMAVGWYHPILPVIALAAALRFQRGRLGDLLLTAAIPLAMLAGCFGIFMITPFGVKWHLETSLYRLIAQVWPLALIAAFTALRTPESMAAEPAGAPSKARSKSRR